LYFVFSLPQYTCARTHKDSERKDGRKKINKINK
jgi:hypothetical protein